MPLRRQISCGLILRRMRFRAPELPPPADVLQQLGFARCAHAAPATFCRECQPLAAVSLPALHWQVRASWIGHGGAERAHSTDSLQRGRCAQMTPGALCSFQGPCSQLADNLTTMARAGDRPNKTRSADHLQQQRWNCIECAFVHKPRITWPACDAGLSRLCCRQLGEDCMSAGHCRPSQRLQTRRSDCAGAHLPGPCAGGAHVTVSEGRPVNDCAPVVAQVDAGGAAGLQGGCSARRCSVVQAPWGLQHLQDTTWLNNRAASEAPAFQHRTSLDASLLSTCPAAAAPQQIAELRSLARRLINLHLPAAEAFAVFAGLLISSRGCCLPWRTE